ncbi:hypothetical protein [Natronomonas sp.]|uniref:hypothetical protein n=1 Tax=Natronomonas sp. TaxID=2184060 RepID=UPI002619FE48|nr:hypothetical protein [Natronomonas sp.]
MNDVVRLSRAPTDPSIEPDVIEHRPRVHVVVGDRPFAGEWTLTAGVGDERAETTVLINATDRSSERADTAERAALEAGTESPSSPDPSDSTADPTGTDTSPQETSTRTSAPETPDGTETQRRVGFGAGAVVVLIGVVTVLAYHVRWG